MVTALGDDVWWYDLRGVNAYLVDDGGAVTLVDAGNPWDRRTLLVGVNDAGFQLRDVDRVLVTHFDLDHVGALGRLHGFDATVYVGRQDAPLLTGDRLPKWYTHKGALQLLTGPLVADVDLPVERVSDGDEVGSFTAYHTPGHTPGHTVWVSDALDVAFLGDLVRESGGRLKPSPWAVSYDTAEVARSIEDLVDRAPDVEIAAMGHGVPFRQGGSDRLADLAAGL